MTVAPAAHYLHVMLSEKDVYAVIMALRQKADGDEMLARQGLVPPANANVERLAQALLEQASHARALADRLQNLDDGP